MSDSEPVFDIKPFLTRDEGQHFERKSLFHGRSGRKRLRDRGLLELHAAGPKSWYTLARRLSVSELPVADDGETPAVTRLLRTLVEHAKPVSRQNLQRALNLSDDKHFREHYIRPALTAGVVAMTRPTTPNSRLQAYYLTEVGRSTIEKEGQL